MVVVLVGFSVESKRVKIDLRLRYVNTGKVLVRGIFQHEFVYQCKPFFISNDGRIRSNYATQNQHNFFSHADRANDEIPPDPADDPEFERLLARASTM